MPLSIKEALTRPLNANVTIKATILDVGEIIKTAGKARFYAVLADKTKSCTATVYNPELHSNFIINDGAFIVNAINKGTYLAITSRTRVGVCESTTIPDSITETLPKLPQDGYTSIIDSLSSPARSLVNIKGKVIKKSPKTRKTAYNDVLDFQEVLVRDSTGATKLALWGDHAGTCEEGNLIRVQRCRVKLFEHNQEKKLSTTQYTQMEFLSEDADLNVQETEEDKLVTFDSGENSTAWKTGVLSAIMFVDTYHGCPHSACHNTKMTTVQNDDGVFLQKCYICSKSVKASFANRCAVARILITSGSEENNENEVTFFLPAQAQEFESERAMDLFYLREKLLSFINAPVMYKEQRNVCKAIASA